MDDHSGIRATVEAYYEYVDAEAFDDLFALFSDGIVYHRPGQSAIEGMDEFKRFYLEVRDLEHGTHTIDKLYTDDNGVAVRGRFSGDQGGTPIDIGFADFFTFDDTGLITERHTYTDQGTI